jgi:hypothetical protein
MIVSASFHLSHDEIQQYDGDNDLVVCANSSTISATSAQTRPGSVDGLHGMRSSESL